MSSRIATGFLKYCDFVDKHYLKIITVSTIVGANVGVYDSIKQRNDDRYLLIIASGIVAGSSFGCLAPVVLPVLVLATPGYLAAKGHSALEEFRRKEEKLKESTRLLK